MSGPGFTMMGEEERAYLLDALADGTLTRYRFGRPGGPSYVYRLERQVEQSFGTPHCIAVNSGSSALLAALAALGIGPGDEVIVPGYTFIASMSSIVHAGAVPVLAEIDDSLCLDPDDVAGRITPRTRAIMPVHMLGAPADMAAVRRLADEHGLAVIEDVAQACGGSFQDRRLGTWGDIGAFSLNYFKVVTSGEGGLVVTPSTRLYERAYAFHDHGFRPFRDGAVEDDAMFGLNLRMGDLAGAVALAQLERVDQVLARTRALRAALEAAIGPLPGVRVRRRLDPAGDCATTLVYLFDRRERAQAVAEALDTMTLLDSGRHYYGAMPQLRRIASGGPSPCPFHPWTGPSAKAYKAGALPRTDDVLSRAVALATGASDSYTGTGFGVAADADDEQVATAARRFREAVLS